jgi:hypothetical protein
MTRRPMDASGRQRSGTARQAAAQALAIQALAWLAAEPERIGAFLAASGIGPESIRDAARDPQFLAAILDHVASEESLTLEFAAQAAIRPEEIGRARMSLGSVWERDVP